MPGSRTSPARAEVRPVAPGRSVIGVSEHTVAEVWSPAESLHAWDPPTESILTVRRCRPTAPAVVLGSRQDESLIDPWALGQTGMGLVRRKSGGGLVLVDDALAIWVDVWIPHRPGTVTADVRASMELVGRAWATVLGAADDDLGGRLEVHTGGVTLGAWAELVCFAGLGPGEVLLDGRKLVGLSQRRSRDWSRVQCQVHTVDCVAFPIDLLAAAVRPDTAGPAGIAWLPRVTVESAVGALPAALLAG